MTFGKYPKQASLATALPVTVAPSANDYKHNIDPLELSANESADPPGCFISGGVFDK